MSQSSIGDVNLITIKSKNEIANIKKSCQILANLKKKLYKQMVVGISGLELDRFAEQEIKKNGASPAFKNYQGFKHTICLSFNEQVIHGIPSKRKLENGDLVKMDIGCVYNGMYSDLAFTKVIGKATPEDKLLIQAAKESFQAGLNAIKPGARVGDISAAIWNVIKSYNLFVPLNFSGHGIGYQLHEDPYVKNKGLPNTGVLLRDGMTICIEPMVLQKTHKVKILSDGWTVVSKANRKTAHYEHTVLIKNGKGIILTEGK